MLYVSFWFSQTVIKIEKNQLLVSFMTIALKIRIIIFFIEMEVNISLKLKIEKIISWNDKIRIHPG